MRIQLAQPARFRAWRLGAVVASMIAAMLGGGPTRAYGADEIPSAPTFSFSGFGTLGVVHSSEDRADFTTSPLAPTGAGYTHSWSPDIDSRLGAQVIAHFTPQLSAMLQVISEQRYDKTFKPLVEWANLSYQPTPELGLRLGRIVLPTFLLSDSRKVGYANPWLRPPAEFYALSPVFYSDGADVRYKMHVGEVVSTLVGTYGNATFQAAGGGEFKVRRLWVIADNVEYGALTFHISYQASSFTYHTLDPIFDGFRQFGPQGIALADKYNLDDKTSQVLTAGAIYDPGEWFVTGEWGRRNLHSAVGESTAWYVSGGYKLAKFTPYLTYAAVKSDSKTSDPGLNVSQLPPFLAGPAAALNAGLNTILASAAVQHTISAGARYDVMKNVDLKVQYDRINIGAGSPGTLVNAQSDFQRGGRVNVISIAADFVW
jgi:hypothetical protein